MAIEFRGHIAAIPAYPLAAGYDLGGEMAMLASNESPFAPHPEAVAAAQAALTRVNRYPDPGYAPLREALADRYGIAPERIILGNGSCEILHGAAQVLLEPGAELLYAWPSFSEYPRLAATSGARAVPVPLDAGERHDLDAMVAEITVSTRLVIVCNPNNPTSTALGLEEIEAFLDRVPRHCAVILDEAYCEFALTLGDTYASIQLLRRHPNLMILRTFSKAYGLAGLRAGYGLCGSTELRAAIDQIRQPFFLSVPAQAAATVALAHQDEVERRVSHTVAARIALTDGLRGLGLHVADCETNFIWTHLPDPELEGEIILGLRERGVLVRAGSALGRTGALRVTVGTDAENRRFLGAMGELVT